MGIALIGLGAAGLMAANATKDWNNALGNTLQTLKPLFVSLTAAGTVLMLGTKLIKAYRLALIALRTQVISTAAAFGVIGIVIGAIAIGLGLASSKTKDYTESIEGWDNALQSAQERLRELEDSGQGATKEAGDLRQEIVYLTDALQEFSDLEKTNIVTETQLNEAWDKRTDLLSQFNDLEKTLADTTERAARAAGGNSWETWYDNMKRVFFLGGSTTEEQRKAALAALADTSQNATELYNNVLGVLSKMTLDELTGAYITANNELRKLISAQMELTAVSELEELSKPLNATYDLFVSTQEAIYGLRANEVKSLKEQINDWTDAQQDALDNQLSAVRKNTTDIIAQYRKEYNERVKLLDDETKAQVKALQDQLDLLDEDTKTTDRAAEDSADVKTEAELRLAVSQAWNRKDRATAEANLATFLEERADKLADRQREDARESLQNQIADVQNAADDKKEQWQIELDSNIANQDLILANAEINIQREIDTLERARILKLGILQNQLNDAVTIQDQIRDNAITAINTVIAAQMAAANVSSVPLTTQGAIGMQSGIDYENWAASSGGGIAQYAQGGMITEPSLLYGLRSQKVYATAGENGPERVVSGSGGGITITGNTFNVRSDADIPRIASELMRMRMLKGSFGS